MQNNVRLFCTFSIHTQSKVKQMAESIEGIIERVSEGGNLLVNLVLIDINTWQTSQEVWKAWQSGVKAEGVNTANMGIYRLVDGEVVFDLLGKQGNLFMDDRFQEDTYNGILQYDFFLLPYAMKQHVMSAITGNVSLTVRYSGLRLKTKDCGANYCFIESSDSNTDEEKKLFNGVYGVENPGNGRKIYLLRQNVVEAQLKDKPTELIAHACYLYYDLNFNANDLCIFSCRSAVRGVRRRRVSEANSASVSEHGAGTNKPLIVEPNFREAYLALKAGKKSFQAPNGVYELRKT